MAKLVRETEFMDDSGFFLVSPGNPIVLITKRFEKRQLCYLTKASKLKYLKRFKSNIFIVFYMVLEMENINYSQLWITVPTELLLLLRRIQHL